MKIEKVNKENYVSCANLMSKLYKSSIEEILPELQETIDSQKDTILLGYINNIPIGFCHISLRGDYVEGLSEKPVGYLEGIYILDEYRKNGYARKLVEAGLNWAKENGAKVYASDCEITNQLSIDFHRKIGFKETNRIVCFMKEC